MKTVVKDDQIIFVTEGQEDEALNAWAKDRRNHMFSVHHASDMTFRLIHLGIRENVYREPLNIMSNSEDAVSRLISNLAHTPFELDGKQYASVEAFWQGLKWPDEKRREEIAILHGQDARRSGSGAPRRTTLKYGDIVVRVGTYDHWALMATACWAKFEQNREAREALLSTGDRPLVHKPKRDSRNIPGPIMAEIWMNIRNGLRNGEGLSGN